MAPVDVTAAVKTFSVCSTLLFIKFLITTLIQGRKSLAAGARPPEDSSFNKNGHLPPQTYSGLVDTTAAGSDLANADENLRHARTVDFRWKRIVQNDIETIPIGLIVFLGSMLADGHETTNCVLLGIFTAARIAHTIAYANRLQPFRSLFWLVGQLCVLAIGLNGFISFLA